MTMLEKAARAARKEIDKLRKARVPEYPGSWKTHDGLGWENLDDVVAAATRAVLMAIKEPDETLSRAAQSTEGWEAMIDAILNESTKEVVS